MMLSDETKCKLTKELYGAPLHVCIDTVEAAVLAELEKQEPVAWRYSNPDGSWYVCGINRTDLERVPLYLHPAPLQEGDSK